MTRLQKVPTLLFALIIGFAAEMCFGAISVVAVLSGGIGPCGFTGEAPGFIRIIHQPGSWAAGLLVADSSPAYLPLVVLNTTVFLSFLAFFILRLIADRKETRLVSSSLHNLNTGGDSLPTDGDCGSASEE